MSGELAAGATHRSCLFPDTLVNRPPPTFDLHFLIPLDTASLNVSRPAQFQRRLRTSPSGSLADGGYSTCGHTSGVSSAFHSEVEVVLTSNSALTQPTVAVKVGADEKTYYLHKGLLMEHSSYFRAALDPSKFKEGETGIILLPDVESKVFNLFAEWLYRSAMRSEESLTFNCHMQFLDADPWMSLTKFYIFADRFLVSKLQHFVLNYAFSRFYRQGLPPTHNAINYGCGHLPEKSTFIRVLAEGFGENWKKDEVDRELEMFENLPRAFRVQAIKRLIECLHGNSEVRTPWSKIEKAFKRQELGEETDDNEPKMKRRRTMTQIR